jgi:hypothetical protein
MAHNPIVEQRKLGRFEQVEIPMQRDGYLYERGGFYRQVLSGDTLTFGERAKGGWNFYLVDKGTHQMRWNARFRAKGQRDQFNLTVDLRYRVANTRQMVEENITDTEALIVRQLEPLFRKAARDFTLADHQIAETEFESLITSSLFDSCGLELLHSDVVIHISDDELTHIEDARRLSRAMKVPQQVVHSAELASYDPTHQFRTEVILDYRVTNPKSLPTDTLQEAEEWLWRRVRASLKRVGRKYAVDQLVEVDDALLAKLEDEVFEAHGLEIVSAEIEVSLDEAAFGYAQKLAEIRRQRRITEEEQLTDELKQNHELSSKQRYLEFYAPRVESGDWAMLAVALAENRMDAKEVYDHLNARQQQKLNTQLNLLGIMLDKDAVSELDAEKFAQRVLHEVVRPTDSPDRILEAPDLDDLRDPEDGSGKTEAEDGDDDILDAERSDDDWNKWEVPEIELPDDEQGEDKPDA